MGNIFAGSEVVELGIQIEKNGLDFYSTLAKQTKNEFARGLFQYLAGEEEKHIKAFQGILDKKEKYEPQGLDADDYFSYMNALAEEYVFTKENKGKEIAKKIKSDKEAAGIGIGFEKDSIIFYEGIKKVVPEFDYKILDELIIQEQNHLRQLNELKKKLI
ncbi:MAG: ferritin family protein [Candidatus Omnitrophica bacterium]|nr:ferritin family protein [Candidatus Omnitrophota bacterium]